MTTENTHGPLTFPIRLPGSRKAHLQIPCKFYDADKEVISKFLQVIMTDEKFPPLPDLASEIKEQGRKAYAEGKGISDNPYVAKESHHGSKYELSKEWQAGYEAQLKQLREGAEAYEVAERDVSAVYHHIHGDGLVDIPSGGHYIS